MRRTIALTLALLLPALTSAQPLPGTQPLDAKDDLARQMVSGIDAYLTRLTARVVEQRRADWKPDRSSAEAYEKALQPKRERLKKILGVVDERLAPAALELVGDSNNGPLVAEAAAYQVYAVRWPVLQGVHGEGFWFKPRREIAANVILVPDADQLPEQVAGLADSGGEGRLYAVARLLAEQGCQVLVLTLIDRRDSGSANPRIGRATNQPHREFVYRMSFEMGRHIIGYELQKILGAVDWFCRTPGHAAVGVCGYGEGGMLALYAGAIDPRIDAVAVSGYFGPREAVHDEPIYRNVWRLLREGTDVDLATLIAPRGLVVANLQPPAADGPPSPRPGRAGAAPGKLPAFSGEAVASVFDQAAQAWKVMEDWPRFRQPSYIPDKSENPDRRLWIELLNMLVGPPAPLWKTPTPMTIHRARFDAEPRQKRQFDELVGFTQRLLTAGVPSRKKMVWDKLDMSSLEAYQKSQAPLREYFWEEIIGKLPAPTMPMSPRSRLIYDEPKWKGYEVVLDLYDDVICYGILLVPNDIKTGERRPVVVCQHGLEGRPTDVVNPKMRTPYYNSFGAQLADRGYIVFAPQNPYIFRNDFRQVARKANALGLTLYSFIVRQHERILAWLATLPYVDASRIAYYGLSYGGKVAMRIPAILTGYCLSICSGDFNEWIWKNITLDWTGSYMFTGEYEMYEFDLGNTFNYAEMAALICPRPFMVERGHSDGVGLDEYVAFEYAKVRRLYAQLGIADRTAIEFFVGGHVIHGQGTFAFLERHLNWPTSDKASRERQRPE